MENSHTIRFDNADDLVFVSSMKIKHSTTNNDFDFTLTNNGKDVGTMKVVIFDNNVSISIARKSVDETNLRDYQTLIIARDEFPSLKDCLVSYFQME